MYIKKIVIQGFKTYKNATIIDAFSPHHNVVVGRNGSGKSNFFTAIRFVLSDAYTQMSREERQGLIHEGSGTVMSAYVEIYFDNSDKRFPLDETEVVIRRTIGLKKDDYSLNHKSAQRTDIMNLLESAGFSRSNPYYIVPQGKITALTNSKDPERLQLLKEVAGAKVFEQRLKQSLKEMASTNKQRKEIDEMLTFIEERLADLDSEKDELKTFQSLENDKKCCEYSLYDRELTSINDSVEAIDDEYTTQIDGSSKFINDLEKREAVIPQLEETLSELRSSINILKVDKEQSESELHSVLKEIAEINAEIQELEKTSKNISNQSEIESLTKKRLEKAIKEKEQKLAQLKPSVGQISLKEKELRLKLNGLITRQRALYSKQNRFSTFKSKSERDAWLKQKIDELNSQLSLKNKTLSSSKDDLLQNENNLHDIISQIENLELSLNSAGAHRKLEEASNILNEVKEKYTNLLDDRKNLWREEARQRAIVDSVNEELSKANRSVSETMDSSQASGLLAVKKIVSKLGLVGVYGPLGELIEVNEKYKTAVEVIAGNSLFHVVVDNDHTASTVMEELVRSKAGRVTFMPLNRLKPKDVVYPNSNDCVPLIKKIVYDEQFSVAVKQVFSRSVVAISLERGSEIAREYKLTAITLDGDRADKRGVLTGGYRDQKRSRIDALNAQRRRKIETNESERGLNEIIKKIEKIDKRITDVNSEVNLKAARFEKLRSEREPLKIELLKLKNNERIIKENINSLRSMIENLEISDIQIQSQKSEYENEIRSTFKQALDSKEVSELNELNLNVLKLEKELDKVANKLSEQESQVTTIEADLNENLYPRRDSILLGNGKIEGLRGLLGIEMGSQVDFKEKMDKELETQRVKLETLRKQVKAISKRVKEISGELEESNNELNSKEKLLGKARESQRNILRKLQNFQKNSEKNISKKSVLIKRRDDIQRKIRELGVLPEEAFSKKYSEMNGDRLLRKLNQMTKELSKYSHVNKKALGQYNNFTKQRDNLVERRKESDRSKKSIEDLITALEERKDNAISRTFGQVSKGFSEIFEKLVPTGAGKLIIQKKANNGDGNGNGNGNSNGDDNDKLDSILDNYIGVSISVSFNSKSDEQQRIEQLSGGQKSLCAIALILAIQKCDPAPFYLFDEIDANLDAQYRTAVASLINELSESAQFICTTFRSEMLQVADKFFGVMFNNKISRVSEINRDEAMSFIEGQQQRG
ncbi:cohesin subunit SMC3 [Ascoidea rubescens DSM 1968]|uniref:Structural maintenance of chromosomes protein n=1 Tax=Ascoidea rubescens DSM 1968 TaxID=1344418 RepID=A0A1D2VQ72_9ASCO|nr:RecF/RecN/SMC protein [Ascoidea rubescens DSM 1968]ODV63746.1 RecF/RecN/SMC protein [Ascoidea rubescens DSM 1968]